MADTKIYTETEYKRLQRFVNAIYKRLPQHNLDLQNSLPNAFKLNTSRDVDRRHTRDNEKYLARSIYAIINQLRTLPNWTDGENNIRWSINHDSFTVLKMNNGSFWEFNPVNTPDDEVNEFENMPMMPGSPNSIEKRFYDEKQRQTRMNQVLLLSDKKISQLSERASQPLLLTDSSRAVTTQQSGLSVIDYKKEVEELRGLNDMVNVELIQEQRLGQEREIILREEIDKWSTLFTESNRAVEQLQNKLQEYSTMIVDVKTNSTEKINQQRDSLMILERQINELNTELRNQTTLVSASDTNVATLQRQLEEQSKQLMQVSHQLIQESHEKAILWSKHKDTELQLARSSKASKDESQYTIDTLSSQIETQQQRMSEYQRANDSKEIQIQAYKKQINEYAVEIQKIERQYVDTIRHQMDTHRSDNARNLDKMRELNDIISDIAKDREQMLEDTTNQTKDIQYLIDVAQRARQRVHILTQRPHHSESATSPLKIEIKKAPITDTGTSPIPAKQTAKTIATSPIPLIEDKSVSRPLFKDPVNLSQPRSRSVTVKSRPMPTETARLDTSKQRLVDEIRNELVRAEKTQIGNDKIIGEMYKHLLSKEFVDKNHDDKVEYYNLYERLRNKREGLTRNIQLLYKGLEELNEIKLGQQSRDVKVGYLSNYGEILKRSQKLTQALWKPEYGALNVSRIYDLRMIKEESDDDETPEKTPEPKQTLKKEHDMDEFDKDHESVLEAQRLIMNSNRDTNENTLSNTNNNTTMEENEEEEIRVWENVGAGTKKTLGSLSSHVSRIGAYIDRDKSLTKPKYMIDRKIDVSRAFKATTFGIKSMSEKIDNLYRNVGPKV